MSRFIPQEVVEQILSKLPIKPLLRFLTVSKKWYNIITTLKLCKNHTQFMFGFYSSENGYIFCIDKNGTFQEYARYETPVEDRIIRFLSCNGLVCFCDFDQCVILWNPSIRRSLVLPESYINCDGVHELIPSKSSPNFYRYKYHRYVFGVVLDHITYDYKILRTVNHPSGDSEDKTLVEIFRVSHNYWEVLSYNAPFMYAETNQVDLKGISYWVGVGPNYAYIPILISFDGYKECFGSVNMNIPVEGGLGDFVNCQKWLFLFEESLVFVHFVDNEGLFFEDEDDENEQFICTHKVYKMEDSEGKSWSLWCELDFDEKVTPLGFRENGEFLWVGDRDLRYVSITLEHGFTRRSISMNHENTSEICHPITSYTGNHISSVSVPNYVESLALLDATMKPSQPSSL